MIALSIYSKWFYLLLFFLMTKQYKIFVLLFKWPFAGAFIFTRNHCKYFSCPTANSLLCDAHRITMGALFCYYYGYLKATWNHQTFSFDFISSKGYVSIRIWMNHSIGKCSKHAPHISMIQNKCSIHEKKRKEKKQLIIILFCDVVLGLYFKGLWSGCRTISFWNSICFGILTLHLGNWNCDLCFAYWRNRNYLIILSLI